MRGKTVRKEQKPISCSQEFTVSQSVKLLDGNIVIRKTNMISSKQSRNLLFLFVASIFIQSICAFQSSSRAPWQRILQGRGTIATSKISTISCSSTRARQEEKVDGETSFLMKPFTTTSGEIVYVVRLDFQTSGFLDSTHETSKKLTLASPNSCSIKTLCSFL